MKVLNKIWILIILMSFTVSQVLASSVMYGDSDGNLVVDTPIFMTAQSAPTPVSGGGFMYFDGTNFLFSEDGGSAETITEAAGATPSGFTDNGSTITTDTATDELLLGSASSSDGHLLKIEESGGSAPYEILSLVHTTGTANPSPTGDNVAITFTADNEFGDPSEYARIMGDLDNTDGTNVTGGLAFQTTSSGVFENSLFVSPNGITASKTITVSDDVTSQALLTVNQTGASKDAMIRLLNATGGGLYIGIDESDSDKLKFATNVSMTLVPFAVDTANSRVGVNATSPLHTLDVSGVSSGTSPMFRLVSNTTTSDASMKFDIFDGQEITMGLDDSDSSKFKISDNSELGTNDRFTLDSSGYIGINTSNPNSKRLRVYESLNSVASQFEITNFNAGTSADAAMNFSTDAQSFSLGIDSTNDSFQIADNGNLSSNFRFSISSTGTVGINSSTPVARLDVAGGIRPTQITSDPCAGGEYPEGTLFYNTTSDYYCFCNGAGNDVQMHSPTTACF